MKKLKKLTLLHSDDRLFRVGLQTYHFMNMAELLGISQEEAAENAPIRTLATSARDALDEYLSRMELDVS